MHNKLVRDKIPEIIKRQGRTITYRVLSEQAYFKELEAKLLEEVKEYLSSSEPEELADILEVVFALGKCLGMDESGLSEIRALKNEKNGAFDERLFLVSTDEL